MRKLATSGLILTNKWYTETASLKNNSGPQILVRKTLQILNVLLLKELLYC